MPLPYTPDRPLDPPDSVDDEKELCIQCGDWYKPNEMTYHIVNGNKPLYCCYECLDKLNKEELTKN